VDVTRQSEEEFLGIQRNNLFLIAVCTIMCCAATVKPRNDPKGKTWLPMVGSRDETKPAIDLHSRFLFLSKSIIHISSTISTHLESFRNYNIYEPHVLKILGLFKMMKKLSLLMLIFFYRTLFKRKKRQTTN